MEAPATAFVASAQRLGWRVTSCTEVCTDTGQVLEFTRDSSAATVQALRRQGRRCLGPGGEGRVAISLRQSPVAANEAAPRGPRRLAQLPPVRDCGMVETTSAVMEV